MNYVLCLFYIDYYNTFLTKKTLPISNYFLISQKICYNYISSYQGGTTMSTIRPSDSDQKLRLENQRDFLLTIAAKMNISMWQIKTANPEQLDQIQAQWVQYRRQSGDQTNHQSAR